jgi:hypothetical protein
MTTDTNSDALQALETSMQRFVDLLNPQAPQKGSLKLAWHYLQVYADWGLRLPTSEAALSANLGIDKDVPDDGTTEQDKAERDKLKGVIHLVGSYPFFYSMMDSYKKVYSSADYFLKQVFPNIVHLGTNLNNFADQASDQEEAIFSAIVNLVHQGKTQAALTLLGQLIDKAGANANDAKGVVESLKQYASMLTDAEGALEKTGKAIQEDQFFSDQRIAELTGSPAVVETRVVNGVPTQVVVKEAVVGKLDHFKEMIDIEKEEYRQDVIKATTTTTYAWVGLPFFPFGLIAAAIVAGIYGKKAVEDLDEIQKLETSLRTESLELQIALAIRGIQNVAGTGVTKAQLYTLFAIDQTNSIQKAWEGVRDGLVIILEKLKFMITTSEGPAKLKATELIEILAGGAGKKWTDLQPAIADLTENPYILIEPGNISIGEFIQKINAETDLLDLKN